MRNSAIFLAILLIVAFLAPEGHCQRDRRRGGPAVRDISVLGTEHFSEKDVRKVMRTKESGYFSTKRLRMTTLESDILSIVAFYRRNGFLRASAEVEEIEYDEARNNVWITIRVNEGSQTTVRIIDFEGYSVMSPDKLKKAVGMKAGDPLNQDAIAQDEYNIYTLYADAGYIYAAVSTRLAFGEGKVDLTYMIEEGDPAHIGRIRVSGNRRVGEPHIRREITTEPGDLFSRKNVLDSQQHLYDTGLFKDVGIDPTPATEDSGLVDLVVKVKERKMKEVNLGLGYGTLDEANVSVGWRHRNLFKAALLFNVDMVLGTRDFDKGLTRKRLDASLTDRWLFGTRLTGGLQIYGEETLEKYNKGNVVDGEYTLDRIGVDAGVTKDFTRTFRMTLAYKHEFVEIRNPSWNVEDEDTLRLQLGQEVNRSMSFLVERDTRVPFFNPRRGSVLRLTAGVAGGIFGGDNSFTKVTGTWSGYFLTYGNAVFAAGIRAGYTEPFGKSQETGVPVYEQFYVGGTSTLRGYPEQEFGPGNFVLTGNIELRIPMMWKITAVTFLDMGNAWESIDDVSGTDFEIGVPSEEYALRRNTDVKYTFGVGIGLMTPVGPARLDYGFRLKRAIYEDGSREPLGQFHVVIGNAF
ncbi:MAG: outer membrane protein assembly factor BamA [bacterium]|jgi:outer membrane protein insertion porin family